MDWHDHVWGRAHGLAVYDAHGHRIDRVRGFRVEDGGVRVRILGLVDGGKPAVIGADRECVEFEAFVTGAVVRAAD